MRRTVKVKATFDQEAGVWYVEESDLPGLSAEAATIEQLAEKLPGMIADLFEANGWDDGEEKCDTVPIELIAHRFFQAKVSAEA
jgi:hypothetical protein